MARKTRTKSVALSWLGPEIEQSVRTAMEPGLWAMGDAVRDKAKGRAPRASGRLRDSAFIATSKRTDYRRGRGDRRRKQMAQILGRVTPMSVLVGFAAWYSNLFEDSGARRHEIPYKPKSNRGRVRKTLQIPGIGFRKRVSHPGFKARPFLGPALEATKNEAVGDFADEVKRRLERDLGI